MNKKIIAGIIAGVVVLAVALVVILSLTGTIKLNLKGSDNSSNKGTVSDVSGKPDKNSDVDSTSETDNNSSFSMTDRNTGKDTVEVKDAVIDNGAITVPIYATKNDGMCAARIFVKFDTSAFDYADVTAGDIFDECSANFKDGQVTIVATSKNGLDNISGAGVIANLLLVKKSSTKSGEYTVTIDEKSEYANNNDKLVHPTVEAGKIVIK